MPARKKAEPVETVVRSEKMKSFLTANKVPTVVLAPIERMLLAEGADEEPRATDVLHVSELADETFCPRAAYLRIIGKHVQEDEETRMRVQAFFEEGHDIHFKYQRWLRRTGRLYGSWLCVVCENRWFGLSPKECPSCQAPGWKILYKEVPIDARDEYFIVGHGDAQLDGPKGHWIEAKSIGIGTVRKEAPRVLTRYSHKGLLLSDIDQYLEWLTGKHRDSFLTGEAVSDLDNIPKAIVSRWVDFDGLWKELRRPFPSHLRQGHLYGFLAKVEDVVFVYEFKPNQAVKEFSIKPSENIYGPLIDMALDVKWAVDQNKEPRCIHDDCAQCKAYEKRTNGQGSSPQTEGPARETGDNQRHRTVDRRANTASQSRTRSTRSVPAAQAGRRAPRVAQRSNGSGRPGTDGVVLPVHGLGRLLGGSTRTRRD